MSYMAKKTQKRQTTIISLSDSNQQELENIKQQREQMLNEYQEKKQGNWYILQDNFTYRKTRKGRDLKLKMAVDLLLKIFVEVVCRIV